VQSSCSFVDVVESAEDRSDSHAALRLLERRRGSFQAEAAMWSIVVVVVDQLAQDRAQVTLAEGYQVVEAFPADSPHEMPIPGWVEPSNDQPEETILALEVRSRARAGRDLELVAQEQVLDHEVVALVEEGGQGGEEHAE